MKKTLLSVLVLGTVVLAACNNGGGDKTDATQDSTQSTVATTGQAPASDDKDLKVVNAKYTGIDAKVTGPLKEVVEHYVHLKNALASDNGNDAATAAKALNGSLAKVDPSSLNAEQKKVFADNADDMKEMAQHISESAGKIDHQREHFQMLSDDVYEVVSAFGAGTTLYRDFCPMYNDNKGAYWLSETKEVKNPYLGGKMPACGKVQEVVKQ